MSAPTQGAAGAGEEAGGPYPAAAGSSVCTLLAALQPAIAAAGPGPDAASSRSPSGKVTISALVDEQKGLITWLASSYVIQLLIY